MNTIFRIVWNAATGKWVVASELAKGRTKPTSSRVRMHASALALALCAMLPADPARAENATGGGNAGSNSASGRPGGSGNGWGGRGSYAGGMESPAAEPPVDGHGGDGTVSSGSPGSPGVGGVAGTTVLPGITAGGTVSGGNGGNGTSSAATGGGGGGGGAGASLTDIGSATSTAIILGGHGGAGGLGAGGGGGGAGLMLKGVSVSSSLTVAAGITGGNGGAAGNPNNSAGNGGGGGGGAGVVLDTTASTLGATLALINNNAITGGTGGRGGGTGEGSGAGGGGGAGLALVGTGISVTNATTATISGGRSGWNDRSAYRPSGGSGIWVNGDDTSIINDGSINGGNGHANGASATHGGTGISATSSSVTGTDIRNTGSIRGGDGGGGNGAGGSGIAANATTLTHASGAIMGGAGVGSGAGGVGISGGNLAIAAASSISGGLAGDGVTRADALNFTGGDNTLTLQAGWSLDGNIAINNGTLTFNQAIPAVLANVITGNGTVVNDASGVLQLGGANTYSGGTVFAGGVVRVAADNNLGAASGALRFDGGTLNTTASFASARTVTLTAGEATFDIDAGTTLSMLGAIRGSGVLTKSDAGALVLTGDNTYDGGTAIEGGTLFVGDGGTSGLLGTGPVVNDAVLAFDRSDTVVFDGTISGTGALRQIGAGTLVLTGDNTFGGGTAIESGTLMVGDGGTSGALGSGDVDNNGVLVFDRSDRLVFDAAISGMGVLQQVGAGTVVLTGANTYGGGTVITGGTLVVGDGGTSGTLGTGPVINDAVLAFDRNDTLVFGESISGTGALQMIGAGTLVLAGDNTYTGTTTVAAGTLAADRPNALGAQSAHVVQEGGTLDVQGFDQRVASLDNAGLVNLAGPPGATLTVTGDYVGRRGGLALNVALGSDGSPTDLLVVEGDTSGETFLVVDDVGGTGGATTADGIQVVRVDGASNGTFTQLGRFVAGVSEYLLHQGGVTHPDDGDWYLRSEMLGATSAPGPVLRPEAGAYLANQAAGRSLFQHAMHDRLGEPNLAERLRRDDTRGSSWMRIVRSEADDITVEAQLDIDTEVSLLQLGTDLLRWGERGRGQIGAMVAAGKARNRTTSVATGFTAKGKVEGTALGMYGTWFSEPAALTGLYVDTWLQYARNRHRVHGEGLTEERYDTHALTGSVEAGYAWNVFAGANQGVFVEPQLQAVYADDHGGTHVEANGTVVETATASGWSTRIGVRLFGQGTVAQGKRVQPFATVNWLRDEDNAMAFDGDRLMGGAPRDRHELKLGVQAEVGEAWTVWGHLGVQRGDDDFRNAGGQVGLKRHW